ncbi:MAG TPA: ferredoxin [Thermoanaerobaculia bacterium]
MADPKDKLPENVSGRYYVDSQCIDCDVCRVTAPANFQRDGEKGYSYVFFQPASPEQEQQCQEAMDSCPVEAIGDDGVPHARSASSTVLK